MTIAIAGMPPALSAKLIEEYLDIKKHFAMNDWGPGELKGGRLAEVMLRVYQHLLGDSVTPFGTNIVPRDKIRILNAVENAGPIDAHVRQKTAPLVRLLLDFRNNRDVAHLGGFDANSMDALFVMTSATWMLCELVRVYGGYAMPEAQKIVDALSVKEYPVIMERDGELFITRHDLKAKQKVLVLLTKNASATVDLLYEKSGDSNKSRFQSTLEKMMSGKFIGQAANGEYFIMPRGQAIVAKESLLTYRP
jgi:hypothetical protein